MKRLIVLRRNEEDNRMYIIEENKFEMTLLSECYDKFGQKIGKENAEDYCLENNYCTDSAKNQNPSYIFLLFDSLPIMDSYPFDI